MTHAASALSAIGSVTLAQLLGAAFAVAMLPFAAVILLVWYVPVGLIAFAGRRLNIWTWRPF